MYKLYMDKAFTLSACIHTHSNTLHLRICRGCLSGWKRHVKFNTDTNTQIKRVTVRSVTHLLWHDAIIKQYFCIFSVKLFKPCVDALVSWFITFIKDLHQCRVWIYLSVRVKDELVFNPILTLNWFVQWQIFTAVTVWIINHGSALMTCYILCSILIKMSHQGQK